jgi:RHS repeat-associated protein
VTELSGRTVGYGYDDLYRLTSETINNDGVPSNNGAIGYTYDAVGNRLTRTSTVGAIPSTVSSYDGNDRLTSDSYDSNGSTIGSGGNVYSYDFENRLIGLNPGTANAVTFVYDGDGNRVSKTVGSGASAVTTKFLVDTNSPTGYAEVVEEIISTASGTGSVQRAYAHGHSLISQTQMLGSPTSSWVTSFYGMDGHGSIRFLTDGMGTLTDSYDYDAFGNLIRSTGATPNNYLYTGEQLDSNLGFYYSRARYMNPSSGRFWTSDEYEGRSGEPTTLHKYLYGADDPVGNTDPSGEFSVAETMGAFDVMQTLGAISVVQRPGGSGGKSIQFSIDDAPGVSNQEMRALLSQYNIKTTFFVIGTNAEARQGDVRAIVADGHSLGNHTWDHPQPGLTRMSDDRIKQELTKTDDLIRKITGKSMVPNWRPPYGDINGRVRSAAAAVGFTRPWLWDVDSLDWKYRSNTQKIVDQVKSGLQKCHKPTCHILFHDYSTTAKALRLLIPMLKREGNRIVNFTP